MFASIQVCNVSHYLQTLFEEIRVTLSEVHRESDLLKRKKRQKRREEERGKRREREEKEEREREKGDKKIYF